MFLAKHTLGEVDNLRPGSPRAGLIKEIGSPRRTFVYTRPVKTDGVNPDGKAMRLDEFKLSGWRLTPGEVVGDENHWQWYSVEFVYTAGASEFTSLPTTVGDLARHVSQSRDLRVWYDRSDRVISYKKEYPEERAREATIDGCERGHGKP